MKQLTIANTMNDQDKPKQQRRSYAPSLFSSASRALVPYSPAPRTLSMTQSKDHPNQLMALLLLGFSQLAGAQSIGNTTSSTTRKTTTGKTTTSKTTTSKTTTDMTTTGKTTTSKTTTSKTTTSKTTTSKMTTTNIATAPNSTSSTAVTMYNYANSQSFTIYLKQSNLTFTLLDQLKFDDGRVVEIWPMVDNFIYWMKRYCNFKYCYSINQCGMTDMKTSKPLQVGVPVMYNQVYYSGFFVGQRNYPMGLMQASGNIPLENSQCIAQHLTDAILSSQYNGGKVAGVVFTYIAAIIALLLLGGVARMGIKTYRHHVREENRQHATEMTSLLPKPSSTLKPVTASTDNDLDAQVAEIQAREQAEANPGCLQRLLRR